MTIIRVARRDRFVTVQQSTVRDPKLSLRAVGLMVRLLSYPDNWRISADAIAREVREGRDAVRRALAELEDAGYLTRTKCRVDGARRNLWTTELVLRETPDRSDDGFSGVGKPGVGKPGVGIPGVGNPGANRKTETNDCVDENSRTGLRACACDGTGFLIREVPIDGAEGNRRRRQTRTEAHYCECHPLHPSKRRAPVKARR